MAKNNNLTDFLTDVADAIRAKKGTTSKINPQNFSSEIASIEGGGGAVERTDAAPKDITYYDYDGAILYAYTFEEYLSKGLGYQPELPKRKGLRAQSWTSLPYIMMSAPTARVHFELGASYITDDGKTRLYIRIADIGRMTIPLYFTQTVSNGVTIDWGDGSSVETVSGTGNRNTSHIYANAGDYIITLNVADDCTMSLGRNTSYFVLGSVNDKQNRGVLRRVEIGKNVTQILTGAFYYCYNLETITIPRGVNTIGSSAFRYCYSLKHLTLPEGCKTLNSYCFADCTSLASVVLPTTLTSISGYAFYYCYALSSVSLTSINEVGQYAFINCYGLARVSFDSNDVSFQSYVFRNCLSLTHIRVACDYLSASAFESCTFMAIYDFSGCQDIPTLSSTNVFNSIPSDCKMVVPDSLYDSWIKATNWSTYASYIITKSEYDAQNA